MSTITTTPAKPRRLGARARKGVLLLHIVSSGAWLGLDVAVAVLVGTALLTEDAGVAATSLRGLQLFAIWPMLAASLVCLSSGVVLGLGTKYGLVRYWWVAIKLVANVAMCVLIAFALRALVGTAADVAVRLAVSDPDAHVPADLPMPPIVSLTLLSTAFVLSVFKPWGRLRRQRHDAAGRSPADGSPTRTRAVAET